MMSYTVSILLATAGLLASAPVPVAPAAPAGPETVLHWERTREGAVAVSARTSGPELARAQVEVQALADRLDAIRMVDQHVVWRSIKWDDGRVRVDGYADTATYANVALMAGRRLFGAQSSRGSHIQQLRRRTDAGMQWRLRIQLSADRPE